MNDKNQTQDNNKGGNPYGKSGEGMQGIDKAPGEEPSRDDVQFSQEALKGKKVDADPSKEEEKPLDHQDL